MIKLFLSLALFFSMSLSNLNAQMPPMDGNPPAVNPGDYRCACFTLYESGQYLGCDVGFEGSREYRKDMTEAECKECKFCNDIEKVRVKVQWTFDPTDVEDNLRFVSIEYGSISLNRNSTSGHERIEFIIRSAEGERDLEFFKKDLKTIRMTGHAKAFYQIVEHNDPAMVGIIVGLNTTLKEVILPIGTDTKSVTMKSELFINDEWRNYRPDANELNQGTVLEFGRPDADYSDVKEEVIHYPSYIPK